MSEFKKMECGAAFAHATVGELKDFCGKVFTRDVIGSTSCELSFGTLGAGQSVPFFHSHKENEEHYIVLSGKGLFQVDDTVFPIQSGSVVRVATGASRNLKNTGEGDMTYICIQACEGSLSHCTADDAEITEQKGM